MGSAPVINLGKVALYTLLQCLPLMLPPWWDFVPAGAEKNGVISPFSKPCS